MGRNSSRPLLLLSSWNARRIILLRVCTTRGGVNTRTIDIRTHTIDIRTHTRIVHNWWGMDTTAHWRRDVLSEELLEEHGRG